MNDVFDLISDIFSENSHTNETRIQPTNETAQTNNNDIEDPFAWLNPTYVEPVQEAEIIEETAIQVQEVEEVSAVLQPSPEIDDGPTEEELEEMARLLSGEGANEDEDFDDEDIIEVADDEFTPSIGSVDNLDPRIRQIIASVSDEDLEDLFIGNLNCVTYQYNILSVSREDFVAFIQGYRLLNGIVFDDDGNIDGSGEFTNENGFPRNLTPDEERALELINLTVRGTEVENVEEVNETTVRHSNRYFRTEDLNNIRNRYPELSGISLSLLNRLLLGELLLGEIEIPEGIDIDRVRNIITFERLFNDTLFNQTNEISEEPVESNRYLIDDEWVEYVDRFISGELSLQTNAPPPGWGIQQFEEFINVERLLRSNIEYTNHTSEESTLIPAENIGSLETWASAPPDYTSSRINAFADFTNEDLRETSFGNIGNAELQEVAEATIRDVFIDSLADPNFEVTPENNILNDSPNRYGLVKANYDRFKGADWFTIAQQQTIVLAGLGGIGSWTSLMLSRIGPKTIYAFDDDSFEAHNMSGQLVNLQFLGKPKTFSALHMANQFSNYNGMQIYTERFTKSTKGDKVMICGFDSMSARRDYFESWKREVSATPEDIRHECLFIDGRLTAELFQIFTLVGNDAYAIQEYEQKFLYDDSIADEEDCTLKQTSHLAAMIGSYMTMHFTNFCSNLSGEDSLKRIPWFLEFNSTTNTYIHEF